LVNDQLGDVSDRLLGGANRRARGGVEIVGVVRTLIHKNRHQNFLPVGEPEATCVSADVSRRADLTAGFVPDGSE
jgi:hypothetical protein